MFLFCWGQEEGDFLVLFQTLSKNPEQVLWPHKDVYGHRHPPVGLQVNVVEREGTLGSGITNVPFHRLGHRGPEAL